MFLNLNRLAVLFFSLLALTAIVKANEKFSGVKMTQDKVTRRVGSLIKVKPEFEEQYIILHKNAFPGVLERISKSNIKNYTIFLLDGILFSHYEYTGNDYDEDMKAMADSAIKNWWKFTDPMQEPLPTRKEGEWWAVMDQVLCLDKIVKPSSEAQRIGLAAQMISGKNEEIKAYIKNFPAGLEEEVNKYNFQNSNMYCKDGKLYFYYEYTGSSFNNDMRGLSQNEKFNSFQDGLKQYLVNNNNRYWEVMKEVFHTN
jgi:L-rhamnose mutarotase